MKKVAKTSAEQGTKIIDTMKRIGASIASAFAVKKIVDFSKTLVNHAANVEAELSQLQATFKRTGKDGYDLTKQAEDMFARVSKSTGILTERLRITGTKGFAQLKGSGLDANTALKSTERFLNLASDAAAYYDISLENAEATIRSFVRGNVSAGDSVGLFTSETQRDSKAVELYGKQFIKLTESQKQMVMLDIAETIYKQSGAIGQASREAEAYTNVSENLKEAWRQLMAVFGSPIMARLIPVMQAVTNKLVTMRDKVTDAKDWLERHAEAVDKLKTALVFASGAILTFIAASAGLKIVKGISTLFTTAVGAISGFRGGLGLLSAMKTPTIFGLIVAALVVGIGLFIRAWNTNEEFRDKVTTAWNTLKTVLSPVIDALMTLVSAFGDLFVALWDRISPALDYLRDGISQAFSAVATFIGNHQTEIINVLTTIVDAITGIVNTVTAIFNGDWKGAWDSFVGVVDNIWSLIEPVLTFLGDGIKNILTGIVSWLSEKWVAFTTAIQTKFDEFKGWLSQKLDVIVGFFANLGTNIKDALSNALGAIADIGRNLVEGLWQGIDNAKDWILDKVKGFGSSVLNGIKKILGIASPSKKTEEMGGYLVQGLSNGIDDEKGGMLDKIKEFGKSILDKFDVDLLQKFKDSSIGKTIMSALGFDVAPVVKQTEDAGTTVVESVETTNKNLLTKIKDWYTQVKRAYDEGFGKWYKSTSQSVQKIATKIKDGLDTAIGYVNGYLAPLFDSIAEYEDTLAQNEIDAMERQLEESKKRHKEELTDAEKQSKEELAILQAQYKQGMISYADYAKRKKTIDSNLSSTKKKQKEDEANDEKALLEKKDALARKQFEANKKTQIANVWVNAAQAIMTSYAQMGWIAGTIASALILATAGVQTANINAQQYTPMLATGGVVDTPTRAIIGEDGAEAVVPLERNTRWIDGLAHSINEKLTTPNTKGYTHNDLSDLVDAIREEIRNLNQDMSDYLSQLLGKDPTLVLDTGVLVGATAKQMDTRLGDISRLRRRGR